MKRRSYIFAVGIIIILIAIVVEIHLHNNRLNGSTIESRELILNKTMNELHIATEIKINDYIISGIIGSNNRYGLAVFVPLAKGKYSFQTSVLREKGRTIIADTIINDDVYNIFWRNQVDLEYAEIIYTVKGKKHKSIKLDARDNKILYAKAPNNDYSIEVVYYDNQGNRYE